MESLSFDRWQDLSGWLGQFNPEGKKFAFRGQADSEWPLRTRLARHFLDYHVASNEWRRRELKMYCDFRTRLLERCQSMYCKREPLDILSLMQHHGAPTRLLDFSFDPKVAAYFAVEDSRNESAIWVVDPEALAKRREQMGLPNYCGPTHVPDYDFFQKDDEGQYLLVGSILEAEYPHGRLVAQRGCFFVPGSISKAINHELVHTKVKLSKRLSEEAIDHLTKEGYDCGALFPDLDRIAQQARRAAVLGSPHWVCTGGHNAKQ